MARHVARFALAALLATGCTAAETDDLDLGWDEAGAKADDPTADGVTATSADAVRLLGGYHKLLDTATDACVEPAGEALDYHVGAVEKPFDVFVVSSRDDLARKVGVDLSASIKAATVSANPALSFVDSFQQSRTSVNLLVAAKATYRVTSKGSVRLTPEAESWLATDPRTFLHRCGNFYVNGVELEAQLFVLIHFDLTSATASKTITADLGLAGPAGAVNLDGTLKASLERVAKREDVTMQTHVLDRGFLVDGGTGALMGSLLTGTLTADTFTKIDAVRAAMTSSLQGDVTRDATDYRGNTMRYAMPVRVDLRPYSRAQNAPLGGVGSPYEAIRNIIVPADQYLRALSRTAVRLDAVDHDEIQAFLGASAERKALFGIAPPAAPVFDVPAMTVIAQRQQTAIAAARDGVLDLASQCLASASEGALEACRAPDGTNPALLPELVAADRAIADYGRTGRIVPLAFSVKGVLRYDRGQDECARGAQRLPTLDEAKRLALPIGYATLPRSTTADLSHAAWHSGTSTCANIGGFPAFANPNPRAICATDGILSTPTMTTLCVPSQGPFAGLPTL